MKALYKLHFRTDLDYGTGFLEGLFIADTEQIDKVMNTFIDFGEIYKDIEIQGKLEYNDIIMITVDKNIIKIVKEYKLEIGYNLLDYI